MAEKLVSWELFRGRNGIMTRTIFYFLFYWLLLLEGHRPAFAQPGPADSISLRNEIAVIGDLMWKDFPTAIKRAEQVHQKALRSSCISCQADSHLLMSSGFLNDGQYANSLRHARTALAITLQNGDKKIQAAVLNRMGTIFYYQAYYDSGDYFYNRALKVHEANENIQGMITVLHNLSLMYHRKGDFNKTIEYLFKEEALKDKLPTSVHEVEAMGAMGSLMIDSIYYREEITDELKAIEIFRKANDKRAKARAYRNIARAHRQLKEYQSAARYFVKAETIMEELGFVPDWDQAGIDYRDANIKDSAFYYHYLAKRFFKQKGKSDVAYTLELLGDAHRYFHQPDSALFYYDTALSMNYKLNNRITFTGIHRYLVNVHTQLRNYKEAERHLETGLRLAKEVALIHEMNLFREGRNLYQALGDYKKALWFSEQSRIYTDSLHKAEAALNLTKMQAEFKTAKKTREVEELRQQELLSRATMEARNLQIGLAIALLAVVATAGGLYYSRYRNKEKLNQRLQASNKEKEELLQEIHHRVKNNLQIISSLINLKTRQGSPETNEALHEINSRIYSMGLIHEKLYLNENIQRIRLDEYLRDVGSYLVSSFGENEHPVSLKLNCEHVEVDIDRALTCGLIANELLTNSMKYAFTKEQEQREVAMQLKQRNDMVSLSISDNGMSIKPTDGLIKKSFGSRFVEQLVSTKLKGEWSVNVANGFQVNIDFANL
jgi:two-component system, sensor histidine kinase PdtaS